MVSGMSVALNLCCDVHFIRQMLRLFALLAAITVGVEVSADTRSILRVHHGVQTSCIKREESKPRSRKFSCLVCIMF